MVHSVADEGKSIQSQADIRSTPDIQQSETERELYILEELAGATGFRHCMRGVGLMYTAYCIQYARVSGS